MISTVRGQFKDVSADVKTHGDNWDNAEVQVRIPIAGITTGNEGRDQHLQSGDFFESDKHPDIIIKNGRLEKTGQDQFKLKADVEIRGHVQPETFEVTKTGSIVDPYGLERTAFELKGSLDRFDYGLRWNNMLETGGAVVGKEVKINADLQFTKQK